MSERETTAIRHDLSSLSGRSVLVTGAGGFIGSHLVERLVEGGASVTALLRYTSEGGLGALRYLSPDVLSSVRLEYGDVCDAGVVNTLVSECDLVFNLAALISVSYSFVAPRSFMQTNALGAQNVMEACLLHSARLVQMSTSEVYGTAQYLPMDECHPLSAHSPYAASKIAADALVQSYRRGLGLDAVIVRPFNTFGPRQTGRALVPSLIAQALSGQRVSVGATSPRRDLTFVSDTVEGLCAAAGAPSDGIAINLGTGQSHSVLQVAEKVLELVQTNATLQIDPDRLRPADAEVQELRSDNRRAQHVLAWCPKVTLEEGMLNTIAFLRSHPLAPALPRTHI